VPHPVLRPWPWLRASSRSRVGQDRMALEVHGGAEAVLAQPGGTSMAAPTEWSDRTGHCMGEPLPGSLERDNTSDLSLTIIQPSRHSAASYRHGDDLRTVRLRTANAHNRRDDRFCGARNHRCFLRTPPIYATIRRIGPDEGVTVDTIPVSHRSAAGPRSPSAAARRAVPGSALPGFPIPLESRGRERPEGRAELRARRLGAGRLTGRGRIAEGEQLSRPQQVRLPTAARPVR
jgi:hypothetical protein